MGMGIHIHHLHMYILAPFELQEAQGAQHRENLRRLGIMEEILRHTDSFPLPIYPQLKIKLCLWYSFEIYIFLFLYQFLLATLNFACNIHLITFFT